MPFNIGAPELIIILVIALVVLGPGKLPDVAASLGKSLREFRKAATDVQDAAKLDGPPANPSAPAQASTPASSAAEATPPAEPGATTSATTDAPASHSSQT